MLSRSAAAAAHAWAGQAECSVTQHLFWLMSVISLQLDAADDVKEGPLHWHEQHVLS
jgi:hypothetical protein